MIRTMTMVVMPSMGKKAQLLGLEIKFIMIGLVVSLVLCTGLFVAGVLFFDIPSFVTNLLC